MIWDGWSWQDWLTALSFAFGLISLGLTIATLIKAGSISKAVKNANEKQLNKMKFMHRKDYLIKKLNDIKCMLAGNPRSRRSSGEIQRIFLSAEDAVLNLLECSGHLSDKHKNTVVSCKEFISKSLRGEHILDYADCNTLREYIAEITSILNQEEYWI